MITIHNSSLAFNRVGSVKPDQDEFALKKAPAQRIGNAPDEKDQGLPASTPEQIQSAIAKAGLSKQDSFSQGTDRRVNKALQTYSQTLNQPIQVQLDNSISGVDYYA